MKLQTLMVATFLGLTASTAGLADAANTARAHKPDAPPPGIRLWTSHGDTYRRGERVRIFFRTEQDSYVTIFRVDTDGRVRVLFPREPVEENYVRGGATYDVPNYGQHDAFVVDDDPGVGYVYGIASSAPFAYDVFENADHWDIAMVSDGGRIHGDPYQSLQELSQRIMPPGYTDYDTHLLPYYVERHYDYPRFLCYDCHSYVNYSSWDPYDYWCPRYTLFVYRDPFYFYPSYWYPTRYYGGTRVVYARPQERGGQYTFKNRADQSAPAIAYRDRRQTDLADRTPSDRGVRGADIGGVGTIPVPGGRRAIGDGGGAGASYQGGRVPESRIPYISGNNPAAGRRGDLVPGGSPDAGSPKSGVDAGGRRAIPPSEAPAQQTPRYVQPLNDRPRGVYIDPNTPNDSRGQPAAKDPAGRRAEPVYLGRPQQNAQPQTRSPERRQAEPQAAPQPRSAPPPRVSEPRTAPPPRSAEPRSAPPPRSSGSSGSKGEGRRRP